MKFADDPEALKRGYALAVALTRKRYETLTVQLREVEALLRDLEQNGHLARHGATKPARLSLAQIIRQTLDAHGPALALDELHTRANALAGRTIPRPSLRVTVAKLVRRAGPRRHRRGRSISGGVDDGRPR